MPDPSLIHGRALPAPELPTGTVTVRVVRESIGNDAPGQTVRVSIGGKTVTATTDAMGRAEFNSLAVGPGGARHRDGGRRGARVAAVQRADERRTARHPGGGDRRRRRASCAGGGEGRRRAGRKGVVVFGGNSRVLMQFDNDSLQVYYVLEIVNNARTRVDVGGPLVVDLPPGASGATSLEGSSKVAHRQRQPADDHRAVRRRHHAGADRLPAGLRRQHVDARAAVAGRVRAGDGRRGESGRAGDDLAAAADDQRGDGRRRHRVRAGTRPGAGGRPAAHA